MPKEYSFLNLPEKCSLEDYKKATEDIVAKYSRIREVASIYSWGNVSVAGISDIDVLLVFRDNPKPLPFSMRSFIFLDKKSRYLARHPFVFIDENSFRKIRYVYPDTNFKLLHGRNIKIENISNSEKCDSYIALLNDIIIRHYPRDFGQSMGNSISVRDALLRLNSLKYSMSMLEFLSRQKNKKWDDNLKRIDELRKNWFDDKDYGELIELNEDALQITIDFIGRFREFLAENSQVKIKSDDIFYNGIKNKALFVKNWDKKKPFAKDKPDCPILPIELAAQLVEYSKINGLISSYIRKNLSKRAECSIRHKEIAAKRICIFNMQAELAHKLRHSDFAAYFDFGYRNGSGINNWILKIADKLRF